MKEGKGSDVLSMGQFLDFAVDRILNNRAGGSWHTILAASVVPMITTFFMWRARTTVEVSDPEKCQWIQLWLSHQYTAVQRVRHLFLAPCNYRQSDRHSYNTRHGEDRNHDSSQGRFAPPAFTFLPAKGVSAWVFFMGWPVSVAASRFQESNRVPGYKLTIWFAPRGTTIATALLLQGRQEWVAKRALKTEIWLVKTRHSPTCFDITSKKSRPLDSVIVEGGIKEELLADMTHFLDSEEWYVRKGIPYRRGYLLYGPPGCGKTSLITALAGALRLPIILLALGSKSMGDETLFGAIAAAPRDSLILIEDVDCAFQNEKDRDRYSQSVTLSGLLNAIDGVAAQEGRVIFLTTNHKERLTEALIRPGRVDVQRYLGNASKDGAVKLFDQFFRPGSDGAQDGNNATITTARSDFLDQVEPHVHSFARLQGILMDSRNNPSLAAKCLRATYQEESELFDIASLNKQLHRHRSSRIERLDDKFEGRLAMMEHACKCNGCSSKACQKWKDAISHINAKECKNEFNCEKFQSIARLAMVHARKCTSGDCPVPFCGLVQHREDEEEKAYVKELWEKLKTPPKEQDKESSQHGTNEEKQDGAKGGTAAESSSLKP